MKIATRSLLTLCFGVLCCWAPLSLAQTPAATPTAAPKPITDADLAGAPVPNADARSKGDPDGSLTGTASDIAVTDTKKGATIGDLVNQVGQNKIAINFVWTLVTGFLVMFMQAGFAIVETGLCRAKNANHTMMMNFMVYGVGMLAYWLIGFAIQMGGVGAVANLGGTPPLSAEHVITVFGKPFGIFGQNGLFLVHRGTYDVAVMVLFLFQMVFMDTALTIVTGAAAERWKYAAFIVSSFLMGAFTKSNAILAHDIVIVLTGCFILAFGWFGFNPGSTLGASSNGGLRIGSIAVNTMLAGRPCVHLRGIRRPGDARRRPSRRHFRARHERPVGGTLHRFVRRRKEQLWRLMEWRDRLGYGLVLRR